MTNEARAAKMARELFFLASERKNHNETRARVVELLDAGALSTFELKGAHRIGVTARMRAFTHQPQLLGLLRGQPQLNLMDAAIDGDVASLERFLQGGALPNETDPYKQKCALGFAAGLGHTEVVSFLLGKGADPNLLEKAWDSPLVHALGRSHVEAAEVLWLAGARAEGLLFQVVKRNSPAESVAWVVEHVLDCDQVRGLHESVRYANLAAVEWLLDGGVHIDCRRFSETCLMKAAQYRNLAIVKLLLARGCDAQAVDGQGRTALHYAISADHIHDPDAHFDYFDSALETPVAKALLAAGLAMPDREQRSAT